MMERDQAIRKDSAASKPDSAYLARWIAVDEANTSRLKLIVAQYGWPGPEMVGHDGVLAAFLLVQHADRDPAFQQATLPLVREAYLAGKIPGENYALLQDRVLVGEGQPQIYGSQCRLAPDGTKWVPQPIEDEAHVDQRRREVGLGPLAEYLVLNNKLNPISAR